MAELTISRADCSTLSSEGRVVIPASVRTQLGLKPGDVLNFAVLDGALVMRTRESALRRLQEMFAQTKRPGVSMVDELIAERRAEARREEEERGRLA